jgi:hypothetical protein
VTGSTAASGSRASGSPPRLPDPPGDRGSSAPASGSPALPGSRPSWSARSPRFVDPALRLLTILVAAALGAVSASYEALLSPLYWHGSRLPLATALAVVGNPLLIWFTYLGTGRLLALLAPAGSWLAVMLLAASRTTEGDLLLAGDNWVAFATLLAGSIAFALGVVPIMRYAVPRRTGPPGRAAPPRRTAPPD